MTNQACEWLKKYYGNIDNIQPEDALNHSIRKWRGLQKDVLTQFGLHQGYGYNNDVIFDSENNKVITVDADSCALCKCYLDTSNCLDCPLYKFLGNKFLGKRCDRQSVYQDFINDKNAKPMLDALIGCLPVRFKKFLFVVEVQATDETSAKKMIVGNVKIIK